jgi:aspartyl-tRNA(Asn)/glutamyl-tRNA(Gln) amidotransferase subunit C
MSISLEEIRKIATLARIEIPTAEEQRYTETISAVLEYMKILNEVDTAGVVPTFQVTGLEQIFREDTVVDSMIAEGLIQQFSEIKDRQLVVPAVFE